MGEYSIVFCDKRLDVSHFTVSIFSLLNVLRDNKQFSESNVQLFFLIFRECVAKDM